MVVVFFCVVEQGCSEGIVFIEVVIGVYLQIVVKFVLVLVGFVGEEVGQFVIFKKVLCCIVIVWCLLVIQFEVGEKVECLFVVVEVVGGVVIGRLFGCEAKGVVEVFFFFFLRMMLMILVFFLVLYWVEGLVMIFICLIMLFCMCCKVFVFLVFSRLEGWLLMRMCIF